MLKAIIIASAVAATTAALLLLVKKRSNQVKPVPPLPVHHSRHRTEVFARAKNCLL